MRRLSLLLKLAVIISSVGFMATVGVISYGQYKVYKDLEQIETELLTRIDEEEKAQQKLELELEYNLTDTYVEKVARERLGLVKSTDISFINENE